MLTGTLIGYLGADAKETTSGEKTTISFNVAINQKNGSEEKTTWITCFLNRSTKVVEHLKKGTYVYVSGDLMIDVYKRGENDYIPSVSISVRKLELLNSKESK